MKAHGTRTRARASPTYNSRTSMTMARLRCARCSRSKIACGLKPSWRTRPATTRTMILIPRLRMWPRKARGRKPHACK